MPIWMDPDVLLIVAIVLMAVGAVASSRVNATFAKYSKMPASTFKPANQVAEELLYSGGSDAALMRAKGSLTDHYDPRKNTVGLSEAVFDESSVSAFAVAAHEVGHVMQYKENYGFIRLRNAILPVASFASQASMALVLVGLILGLTNLAFVGVLLYGVILLFQLVTLPVELNASKRAIAMLSDGGYISGAEQEDAAKKVLRAAAMTYVVAALATLVSFLRLLSIAGRRRK